MIETVKMTPASTVQRATIAWSMRFVSKPRSHASEKTRAATAHAPMAVTSVVVGRMAAAPTTPMSTP
jgi:hypothetical protein